LVETSSLGRENQYPPLFSYTAAKNHELKHTLLNPTGHNNSQTIQTRNDDRTAKKSQRAEGPSLPYLGKD